MLRIISLVAMARPLRIISLVAMALPLQIIIYAAMALLFFGAFVYQLIRPAYAAKRGRQVDVRVLSCKKMMDEDEEEEAPERYEVTVNFYNINGEVLVKTLQSGKPYTEGDVIRCCYLDKSDRLYLGTARELLADLKHSAVVFSIFFVVFMGIAAAILWGIPHVNEKPELALLTFGYVISILFMAVGMLGIYKKVKMLRNIHSMRSVTGVLADYAEDSSMDSGEAICREDEKAGERVALVFGGIGVAVFALMLAISLGLPANERDRQGKSSASSTYADVEKAFVLELFCYHEEEELEICDYCVTIYEDGSGRLLIFPVKTVSEKGLDQEIGFTVSQEDRKKIMQWIQGTDGDSLTQGAHRINETTAYASLTFHDGGERYSGGGYCDEGIYAEIYRLLQQVVPAEAWEEMEKRESAYYQR